MKIIDIIKGKKPSLSFEVFPPKSFENFDAAKTSVEAIAKLSPGYMSVTYGAGGSTDVYTPEIARCIADMGVTPLAHLTCISTDEEKVNSILEKLKGIGVENILALRGDLPKGETEHKGIYRHASDLAAKIRDFGGFCIGGACYPEGHPESADIDTDIENLKAKIEAGCEFLTTQMFFDNDIIYAYMDKLARAGVKTTVVPGIMPVTSVKQIERIVMISGNALPERFTRMVEKYSDDPVSMKKAGLEYATEQIRELYTSGFNAVHVYSMNKPDVAMTIQENLAEIIGMKK